MLKPGGEVFLLFPDEVAVSNIYKRLQKNNKWSKYLENVNEVIPDYSIYNIKVALKKVGFSKHYCKTFRQEIREESDKNFKGIKTYFFLIRLLKLTFQTLYFL